MNLKPVKPAFNAPVTPVDTGKISRYWENCQNMELDIYVATPVVALESQMDMIMIHDVELKCCHYSYVTIGRHPVKIKQDTGAEVNIMQICVFDKLSNGDASKSTALLSKAQTTEIMGYGQTP